MEVQEPWTVELFLTWVASREERYEFDGLRPVAMTGATPTIVASRRTYTRPCARGCEGHLARSSVLISAFRRSALRFVTDALITCTKCPGTEQLAADVQIIFEVISPTSGRVDRIEKVREYAAIGTMRRYITVETNFVGVLVLHRRNADDPWTASTLTGEDTLELPEIGLTVAIGEFYEDVDFTGTANE